MANPAPLVHTVFFWLTETTDDAGRANFVAGARALAEAPTVRHCFVGTPAGTPARAVVDNSFDYSLMLWFDDVAAHDAYQVSEVHQQFVDEQGAKFARVVVRDTVMAR